MTAGDTPLCSRCGGERDRPGQRYCRKCIAAYQRERSRRLTRAAHLLKHFGLSADAKIPAAAGEAKNRRSVHADVQVEQLDAAPEIGQGKG